MNIENKQFIRTINTDDPTKEIIIEIKTTKFIKENTLWLDDEKYHPTPRSKNEHVYFIDDDIKVYLNDHYDPKTGKVDNLGHLKTKKLEEIANNRYIMETSGIAVNGIEIQTDRTSQTIILNLALQAKSNKNFTCNWKTKDGFVKLNADQIKTISNEVLEHVQNCFTKESELTEQIKNCNSIDELNNIFW